MSEAENEILLAILEDERAQKERLRKALEEIVAALNEHGELLHVQHIAREALSDECGSP
jgi:hypothetical protein